MSTQSSDRAQVSPSSFVATIESLRRSPDSMAKLDSLLSALMNDQSAQAGGWKNWNDSDSRPVWTSWNEYKDEFKGT